MALETFPGIASHRKESLFPPDVQVHLKNLAKAGHRGIFDEAGCASVANFLGTLPAESVVRVMEEIQTVGDLYHIGEFRKQSLWQKLIHADNTPHLEIALLTRYPQLSTIYVFHGDGRIREAALQRWSKAPTNPLEFTALAYRLNDWVDQVRIAARSCAARLFPKTQAKIIAESSMFLLEQIDLLTRWQPQERSMLENALFRSDVRTEFLGVLERKKVGRAGRILQLALRKDDLDGALFGLFRNARSPHVRAVALHTLITGIATWHTGYEREWVDKSYGKARRVAKTDSRSIQVERNIEDLLKIGADDKTVAIRRTVARGLVSLRSELTSAMKPIGGKLAEDNSSSVRYPAIFYLENS